MRIGYIGLGSQGAGMAEMVARSDHELVVWARRPGVVDRYLEMGAACADSPADLAAQCDIVGTCLMADDDVLDLAESQGMLAAMRPGSVFVNHATINPRTAALLGELGEQRGVHVVDAPVSGSSAAALAKTLLVLASGNDSAIGTAMPMFDTYGRVVRCGPLGAGQAIKIINNALYYANSELVRQAYLLGERVGVNRDSLSAVLQSGSGGSFAASVHSSMFDARSADHIATLAAKDVELLRSLRGFDPEVCRDIHAVAERLVASISALRLLG